MQYSKRYQQTPAMELMRTVAKANPSKYQTPPSTSTNRLGNDPIRIDPILDPGSY
jgi:hypothetical protein